MAENFKTKRTKAASDVKILRKSSTR